MVFMPAILGILPSNSNSAECLTPRLMLPVSPLQCYASASISHIIFRFRNTVNIVIQQRQFSLPSEYEISTPGCIYAARKIRFFWRDKITIAGPREKVFARIRSRFSFFRLRYDCEPSDGTTYRFSRKNYWKGVFLCESGDTSYVRCEHADRNYSILQNDRQVAAFTKDRASIGYGDRYEIRMNNDANLFIVICMVLTIDASKNEGDRATFTYDFGRVGSEERPFDKSWEPD